MERLIFAISAFLFFMAVGVGVFIIGPYNAKVVILAAFLCAGISQFAAQDTKYEAFILSVIMAYIGMALSFCAIVLTAIA